MAKERKASTIISAKKFKGTSTLIKLPYVIGTKEFAEHKFAGLVYLGQANDQLELF